MTDEANLKIPAQLTPELREVLGLMCFTTGPIAHLFRDAGEAIPRKVEDEQAFVLHWLLTLVQAHGADWRRAAADEIDRRVAIVQASKTAGQRCEPNDARGAA